jgi:hypothetical protein
MLIISKKKEFKSNKGVVWLSSTRVVIRFPGARTIAHGVLQVNTSNRLS